MAQHAVKMTLPEIPVGNSDVQFDVYVDDAKLGELRLSRGTVDWYATYASKSHYKVSWTKFAELLEANGKASKR